MSEPPVTLDAETVEAIARRLVERLDEREPQTPELIRAAELAAVLGVGVDSVRRDSARLGGIRVGRPGSKRPALRLDLQTAFDRCREPAHRTNSRPRRQRSSVLRSS
jgi:hypothetical protein